MCGEGGVGGDAGAGEVIRFINLPIINRSAAAPLW